MGSRCGTLLVSRVRQKLGLAPSVSLPVAFSWQIVPLHGALHCWPFTTVGFCVGCVQVFSKLAADRFPTLPEVIHAVEALMPGRRA